MGIFAYRAFTRDGKQSKGTIEALSDGEAKEKIRELQLILIEIKEQLSRKEMKPISSDQLIVFTSQLAQLLSAKIPLYESLLALEEQSRTESYHAIILSIGERIKSGSSLSKAMNDFPDSFPTLYRALISAGEAVGNLELALSRLSILLSYQNKMAKQLMSQLTYPLFLAGLMIVVIGILIGFVIPSLEMLFEGKTLPWFTQLIFSLSREVRNFWPLLFALLIGTGLFGYFQYKRPETKVKLQRTILKVPIVNRYIIQSALARFARTLSTLLDGGLPLTNSLTFAKEALHNSRLVEIVETVSNRVVEGKTISEELSRYKEIPPLFTRMIKIGEDSGKLSPMLNQVAVIYEEEMERTLQRLVTLSQPILLIVMGGVIGSVILSILLPLSDFGSGLEL